MRQSTSDEILIHRGCLSLTPVVFPSTFFCFLFFYPGDKYIIDCAVEQTVWNCLEVSVALFVDPVRAGWRNPCTFLADMQRCRAFRAAV